jgi:hypothetical protein
MCNLGPEAGVCACVDQPLLGDPPNLYFVLDRSGSMAAPWSGAPTGTSKWVTVLDELEQLVVALGPRASYAVAVLPSTKGDSCGAGNEVFPAWPGTPVLRGDAPAGTMGPNEANLLAVLYGITAFGGTPSAATLSGLAPTIKAIPGKTYVIFATDGGPNCNAAARCPVDQCTPNIENAPGCPAQGPTNCCADPTQGGALACLDAAPTIDAVRDLANAGVPVYVVGVPQSEPYAMLLDELAEAGGTAQSGEPKYYAASATDPSALLAALKKIAAQITGTCTLTLDNEPPDPALVNVFLDGSPIPKDGPNGWTLTTTYGDAGAEAGSGDAGAEAGGGDAGAEAGSRDAGAEAGSRDAGAEAGGGDAGAEAGGDAGAEAGSGDAGAEAGSGDAGGRAIVTVLGTSCQRILDGDALDVRVVAGCPTVTN